MSIETDDDRLAFLEDWGHTATFTFTDGSGAVLSDVPGLYEDPSLTKGIRQSNQFSYGQGQDTHSSKPTFMCRASDVAGVANGKAGAVVTHDGLIENFTVYNVQPTGDGMVLIRMMRA